MRKIIIGSTAAFFATTFLVFVSTAARAANPYALTYERDTAVVMRDGIMAKATNVVYHDKARPSALIVPVVP